MKITRKKQLSLYHTIEKKAPASGSTIHQDVIYKIIFNLLYIGLCVTAVLLGNIYVNITVLAITCLLLYCGLKLTAAKFLISVKTSALQSGYMKIPQGTEFYIKITLRNLTPFCYPDCELIFNNDAGISLRSGNNDIYALSLKPFQTLDLNIPACCRYRGVYTFRITKLAVKSEMDNSYISIRRRAGKTFVILSEPEIPILYKFDGLLPKSESEGNPGKITTDRTGNMDFRIYNPKDNIKDINWKLSSKLEDDFMVKEFREDMDSKFAIFVNLTHEIQSYDPIDTMLMMEDKLIRSCLSMCRYMSLRQIPYNFVLCSPQGTEFMECTSPADFNAASELISDKEFYKTSGPGQKNLNDLADLPHINKNGIYIFTLSLSKEFIESILALNDVDIMPNVFLFTSRKEQIPVTRKAKGPDPLYGYQQDMIAFLENKVRSLTVVNPEDRISDIFEYTEDRTR